MTENDRISPTGLVVEHIGLAVGAALALITVVHVWAFVGYDRTSALAALGVVDQPQLLLASVVILATVMLPWFLTMAPQWLPFLRMDSGRPLALRVAAYVAIMSAVLAAIMTVSAALLVVIVLVYGVVWIRRRRARNDGRLRSDGKIVVSPDAYEFSQALLSLAIGAMLLAQLSQPWMPKERLVVNDGSPEVVWVLGSDDANLLVLAPNERVRWVPLADVSSRQICWSNGAWLLRPATDWLMRPKKTPSCPD